MNSNDPDFSYINNNGQKVSGAAATLHEIYTNQGGVGNYNDKVGAAYIEAFIKSNSIDINANIEAQSKRDNFKVV